MARRGLVHNVASDAHSAGNRRPVLTAGIAALEEHLGGDQPLGDWLVRDVPIAILAGDALGPAPTAIRGRARRGGLRGMFDKIRT